MQNFLKAEWNIQVQKGMPKLTENNPGVCSLYQDNYFIPHMDLECLVLCLSDIFQINAVGIFT